MLYQSVQFDVVDDGEGEVEDFAGGGADGGEEAVEEDGLEHAWEELAGGRGWGSMAGKDLLRLPLRIEGQRRLRGYTPDSAAGPWRDWGAWKASSVLSAR